MNEMRLPGLALLNNDTAPSQSSADAGRDPAQAFDAVMSRFSNHAPPSPARNSGADATTKTNDAGRAPEKAQQAGDSRETQPNARPVARTKGLDTDDESAEQATAAAATDPTALMAAVAGSVQLGVQNAALAAMPNGAATRGGQETKGEPADVLEALASKVDKSTGRGGEAGDPHALVAGTDDLKALAAGVAQGKRTPLAAKDTLRIEAPVARAIESVKGDFAEHLVATARSGIEAAVRAPAAAAAPETTSQAIAAAVAGASNGSGTYSIAHAAVAAPVGTAAFASELSQRVVVFAGQKVQRADIAVTPPELGPIAVSIEVRGQEATLAFAASNHTTRAAIEDALPRLREMLSAQGLQLAGTHVGSEPRRDPYRPARDDGAASSGAAPREATATQPISTASNTPLARRMNLIDIEV
ncbi:MAG TPA: flagellar hook-length control protein FliK [Burkholderiaceae bacterium]|nr:flagellar hook-length control protein FliK [Burkholderiaceae bacterium]